MKKCLLIIIAVIMSINSFAQKTENKDGKIHLSLLYTCNTLENTRNGATIVVDFGKISLLATGLIGSSARGTGQVYGYTINSARISTYSLGIGRKISEYNGFKTIAFISGGMFNYHTEESSGGSNDENHPNVAIGIMGEGKRFSFMSGVESNVAGTGLLIGVGLNLSSIH